MVMTIPRLWIYFANSVYCRGGFKAFVKGRSGRSLTGWKVHFERSSSGLDVYRLVAKSTRLSNVGFAECFISEWQKIEVRRLVDNQCYILHSWQNGLYIFFYVIEGFRYYKMIQFTIILNIIYYYCIIITIIVNIY